MLQNSKIMTVRICFLLLLFCFICPMAPQYAAIQLTDGTELLPVNTETIKRQKRARKVRIIKAKRAWKKKTNRRKITDLILGILGTLATIPVVILGAIAFPIWAKVLYFLAAAITLTVGITFLLKGINELSLPGLNWERLRHFGIGWLIFLLGGLVFGIGLGGAIGFGLGGQTAAANTFAIIGLLGGLTGIFFLIRGIVKAILN